MMVPDTHLSSQLTCFYFLLPNYTSNSVNSADQAAHVPLQPSGPTTQWQQENTHLVPVATLLSHQQQSSQKAQNCYNVIDIPGVTRFLHNCLVFPKHIISTKE